MINWDKDNGVSKPDEKQGTKNNNKKNEIKELE